MHPTLALPPEPVITRWGTWIEAALFYSEHLQDFKAVLETFDPKEALSIRSGLRALESPTLVAHLTFIRAFYSRLPAVVHALESRDRSLVDSLAIFEEFKDEVFSAIGENAERVKEKFNSVLERNLGWTAITSIRDILTGGYGIFLLYI